jgi:arylsulfatase A-like enzyme/Tfp pilus assembly protein PilF
MARRRKKITAPRSKVESAPAPAETSSARRPILPLVLVSLVAFAALLYFLRPAPFQPRPMNVVLITVDTLRADRLGSYGNREISTPNLDRMAESAVLFENAATSAPITLPAHASILTGTYPLFHGVRDNGRSALPPERTTLAEVLRPHGYATGAFVGAFVLDSRFGLDQGFDRYFDDFDRSSGASERRGGEVIGEALAWMDSVRDRRFFAWIHLFDPHVPYDPPSELRRSEDLQDLYQGEVEYVDRLVGELAQWLEENALSRDTIVAFTADHGESLGEHGELTHGYFVYDATMRVPLLLRAPHASDGRRVEAQVRTIDLLPTLLDLMGFEAPPENQGQSLVPLMLGNADSLELSAYGESVLPAHYGWSSLASIRTLEQLYVEAPRPELYDRKEDPGSKRNLAAERAGEASDMKALLEETRSRSHGTGLAEAPAVALDEEARARLAALGYVGSAPPPRTGAGAPPDPKDKIEIFNRIRAASAAFDAGAVENAIAGMENVVAEDPEIVEAYVLLGRFHSSGGNTGEAERAFRSALDRDPQYGPALFGLARIYLSRGRHAEALALLDVVDGSAEDPAGLHDLKAEARLGAGDLEGAAREYQKAVELSPQSAPTHFNLAKVLGQIGREEQMLTHLEKAIELDPGSAVAHLYLANASLERGDLERAVALARKGIDLGPEPALAPFGHFILADAYERLGRPEEARREMATAQSLRRAAGPPPES